MTPLHVAPPPTFPFLLPPFHPLSPPNPPLLEPLPRKDTFSWNAKMAQNLPQNPNSALQIFTHMLLSGSPADHHTFPRAITAARLARDLLTGRQVHAHVIKLGFLSDDFVLSSLVSLYGVLDSPLSAQKLLCSSSTLNPVPWTLLMKLHSRNGNPKLALKSFHKMLSSGVVPDPVSIAAALEACRYLKSSIEGKKIHKLARETGLESNPLVANSLAKMYISCDLLQPARKIFDEMPARDVYLWSTVISGTVQNGGFNEGLKLFRNFCYLGKDPDFVIVTAVLPACARVSAGKHGREIHARVIRHIMDDGTIMGNALMDMYIKSGRFDSALKIFSRMGVRDLVSWTSIILGYSLYGNGEVAVKIFKKVMFDLDDAAYYAVLHACSTSCMVEHGRILFRSIKNPKFEHKVLYAGLLARAREFSEAISFMENQEMKKIRVEILKVIIDGCRIHGNLQLGKRMVENLVEIDPLNAENYVMMGNVYASEGRWDMVDEVREMIRDLGLKTKKGCSWIEVLGKIHVFSVGDVSHPRSVRIRWEIERLMERMKPIVDDYSMHDVDEERESVFGGHSEILAMVFGMISVHGKGIIRVTKNLRVSWTCHEFAKQMSKIEEREILLKDPLRFHHFRDGECSCRDIW